jgi:hypothetical protein
MHVPEVLPRQLYRKMATAVGGFEVRPPGWGASGSGSPATQRLACRKETHCEFCQETLPDWKQVLTPSCGANAPAVMNVNFDGRTYSFEVTPGEGGYRLFTEAIRNAFNLPEDSELNITFTCDEPSTGVARS